MKRYRAIIYDTSDNDKILNTSDYFDTLKDCMDWGVDSVRNWEDTKIRYRIEVTEPEKKQEIPIPLIVSSEPSERSVCSEKAFKDVLDFYEIESTAVFNKVLSDRGYRRLKLKKPPLGIDIQTLGKKWVVLGISRFTKKKVFLNEGDADAHRKILKSDSKVAAVIRYGTFYDIWIVYARVCECD